MKKLYLLTLALLVLKFSDLEAQSTFEAVYNLLQANCSASGCHGGVNANAFNVDTSMSAVYNALVGVSPANAAAAAKGDKLIDPGYPARSFLLRKIAHGFSHDLNLDQSSEGISMPDSLLKLKDEEIELVRQWILFGAPDTGTVTDENVLFDYYNGMGKAKLPPPPAPAPGEGIQVYDGPYFLRPGEEAEYYHKYHLKLPADVEVYKIVPRMHGFSHHFILYEFFPTGHQSVPEGTKIFGGDLFQLDNFFNSSFIATWQYDRDLLLPEGTGYFWEPDTRLNLNYHIPNYSQDSIIAAEVYLNIYFRPRQTNTVQMHAGLTSYGRFNPYLLNVPNNATNTVFVNEQTKDETWYLWLIQSHTHKLAKDFDIFLRNANGTKGTQIFEGFFNQDYTFNQQFYDWQHPPVRIFEPQLEINMNNGLVHEATYFNDGPAPVGFGFTTKDEMFITYFQYTTQLPGGTGTNDVIGEESPGLHVFPNPFADDLTVTYTLKNSGLVNIELFDLFGKKLYEIVNEHQSAGNYKSTYNSGSSKGVYLLRFSVNGNSVIKKVVKLD